MEEQTKDTQDTQKFNFKDLLVPGAIVIAGLIIGLAIIYTQNPSLLSFKKGDNLVPDNPNKERIVEVSVSEKDHIRGNPNAKITIVEFSDFQCPFCKLFHPTVKRILEEYPDQVRWVYKHFPLTMIHPEAQSAAEASECAWEQKGDEGFWQFSDLLFENQERLGRDLYLELAEKIGIDKSKFEECLNSRRYKDKVEAQLNEGIVLGFGGTPTSFVNGQVVEGAVPYEELKKIVESLLK